MSVVVVGSGAAGLSAALAAAVAGAEVTVLEAAPELGGTTASSGGAVWVPGHHLAEDDGSAAAYCRAHLAPNPLVDVFLRHGPRAVGFVERHTPARWRVMRYPDSYPDGRDDRNLEVEPVALDGVEGVRGPAHYRSVITNDEFDRYRPHLGGRLPDGLLDGREDHRTMGEGLVVGLVRGCLAAGVRLRTGVRVTGLRRAGREVVGVEHGEDWTPGAVVLATGGFEHDAALVAAGHGQPVLPLSAPECRGDGLRLAASAGAWIGTTGWSWRWPATEVDGEPVMLFAERSLPGSLWVDRTGRRFVDESAHNALLAFDVVDPATGGPAHRPAWAVVDADFAARYGVAGSRDVPAFVVTADTPEALAEAIGVDPAVLRATVERFTGFAETGVDADFGRGATPYDRFNGDRDTPHPVLGPVRTPPFHAVPLGVGVVGTKGGPRTDERARVLDWAGEPVPGLFAAGNAAAAVLGPGTPSNGASIGVALVFGVLAGEAAAG
ncbi:FAD-dependent oxidoreductase [Actinosynnema sp. NPDC020468]|uniref:FAD-dependent oxidoreductase n=1 Tax=Actinosynnema sp. NPDC020468 TaxID=3154488 RepID=UPI0033D14AFE